MGQHPGKVGQHARNLHYRIVKGEYNLDHIVIVFVSILGIIGIGKLLKIGEKRTVSGYRKMKFWESLLLEQILIFGLGLLCIYLFLTKGAYGFYVVFKDFSLKMLLFRIVIIISTYQLVVAVSKIQTVFKSIQSNQ